MKDKQTAVEWLEEKINLYNLEVGMASMRKYIEYAKQMEKEQIISAHNDGALMAYALPFNAPFKKGEEYYNETYGSQAPQRLKEANEE
jgi:fatty acid/phospholipid biosynthesis enzyme